MHKNIKDFEHENKLIIESSFLNEEETFQIIKEFLKKFEWLQKQKNTL